MAGPEMAQAMGTLRAMGVRLQPRPKSVQFLGADADAQPPPGPWAHSLEAAKDSEWQGMAETEAEDEDEPGLLTRVFGAKPTEHSGFLTRMLGPSPTEDSGLYTRVLGPGPTKGAGLVTRVLGPNPQLHPALAGAAPAANAAGGAPPTDPQLHSVAMLGTDPQLHCWSPQGVPGTDPQLHGPLRGATVQELSDVRREMDRLRAGGAA